MGGGGALLLNFVALKHLVERVRKGKERRQGLVVAVGLRAHTLLHTCAYLQREWRGGGLLLKQKKWGRVGGGFTWRVACHWCRTRDLQQRLRC